MHKVLAAALSFVFLAFGVARANEVFCPTSFPIAGPGHNHSEGEGPTYCSQVRQLLDHHCVHATTVMAAGTLDWESSGERSYGEPFFRSNQNEYTRYESYSSRGPPLPAQSFCLAFCS